MIQNDYHNQNINDSIHVSKNICQGRETRETKTNAMNKINSFLGSWPYSHLDTDEKDG